MYNEFETVSELVKCINESWRAKPEEFRLKSLNQMGRYPQFLGGTAQGLMNGDYIIKIDQRTEKVKIDWPVGFTYEKEGKVIFVVNREEIPTEPNPRFDEDYKETPWNSKTKFVDYSIAYGKKTVNSKYNVYNHDKL